MKIAFMSDIHGNAVALDAVLTDIRKKSIDKICVLGDICYRGPEPKRSLELVRSLNADVIKGNADEWVVRGVREGEVPDKALELMNKERQWTVENLTQSDIDYLQQLPEQLNFRYDDVNITAFHATPSSLFEVVPPHASDEKLEQQFFAAADAQVYIYAHISVTLVEKWS
jgi:predicted phosphodiesterase